MPYKITTLECANHPIKVKQTDTKATVELDTEDGKPFGGLEEDFIVLIGLEEINRPRMWYGTIRVKMSSYLLQF